MEIFSFFKQSPPFDAKSSSENWCKIRSRTKAPAFGAFGCLIIIILIFSLILPNEILCNCVFWSILHSKLNFFQLGGEQFVVKTEYKEDFLQSMTPGWNEGWQKDEFECSTGRPFSQFHSFCALMFDEWWRGDNFSYVMSLTHSLVRRKKSLFIFHFQTSPLPLQQSRCDGNSSKSFLVVLLSFISHKQD